MQEAQLTSAYGQRKGEEAEGGGSSRMCPVNMYIPEAFRGFDGQECARICSLKLKCTGGSCILTT